MAESSKVEIKKSEMNGAKVNMTKISDTGIGNTKIKICGLTRMEDIEYVNAVKPDYVGFVFWPKSKRAVDIAKAAELKKKLDPDIQAVGVFVNEETDIVIELLNHNIIDIAQLHGDESEAQIHEIRHKTGKTVIRAIKIKSKEEVLSQIQKFHTEADYLLIDSGMGSGETFDWDIMKEIHGIENSEIIDSERRNSEIGNSEIGNSEIGNSEIGNSEIRNSEIGNPESENSKREDSKIEKPGNEKLIIEKPFFLAGGLNPDNVLDAIARVHPYAVDISSGVETDGKKDREKIEKIVRRVRNEQR